MSEGAFSDVATDVCYMMPKMFIYNGYFSYVKTSYLIKYTMIKLNSSNIVLLSDEIHTS